jgi:alkyl hydroperoxide reductase subunit AhpF
MTPERVVALGGSASEIRAAVDLAGFDAVLAAAEL